jgi:glutathione S-transferase
MTERASARLLTFAPMIDSETTRLLCRWYGIDYVEDDHLFGWVSLLTVLHGGYGRVPLLYGHGVRMSGPRPVVDRFDPLAEPERRLLLTGSHAAGVEADWAAYNGPLAVDVAVFAYFHLLANRSLMAPIFAAPVPATEARLTPLVYPFLRGLLRLLLQLKPERAAAAGDRIRTVFAACDRRLADGRPFLCGERLTLGDIAFAGATAPLLQPVGYGTRMPPVSAMPRALGAIIETLQRHATAAYVTRVYAAVPPATGLSLHN